MNPFEFFDTTILQFLSGFARRSYLFDRTVAVLLNRELLKGGVIVALLWCSWFAKGGGLDDRLDVFRSMGGALAAIAVARLLQLVMPFRLRPIHAPDIEIVIPYGSVARTLDGWASFPSDHAVLFFAVSTAIWLRSRPLGAVAYAWTLIVICLPRVYTGLHYPSDIIGGAVIGTAIMWAADRTALPWRAQNRLISLARAHPGVMYGVTFLVSYQIATLFNDSRRIGVSVLKLVKVVTGFDTFAELP